MYAYTPDAYMQQASPNYPVMNSSNSSGYSGSPMGTPIGTPMQSPSFAMAGSFQNQVPQQSQQLQQLQQHQQQQIRGFEEAMIAQQYFAWYGHMTAMQAGAFPVRHPHQFYHPYTMTPLPAAASAASDARPGQSARLPFSKSQLAALNERFDKSDSIKVDERRAMSKRIGLSEVQIKVWFQNRRFKLRKIKKAQMEMAQMGGQQKHEHQDDTMDSDEEED
ncbi:unnamed protein product [Caenorhabditis nigoni]